MSLEDPIIPAQEEETTNKLLSKKRRREPEIIKSESLQKSIEIISKYDFKFTTDEHIIEYKKCFFAKLIFQPFKAIIILAMIVGKLFALNIGIYWIIIVIS